VHVLHRPTDLLITAPPILILLSSTPFMSMTEESATEESTPSVHTLRAGIVEGPARKT
jgi:hypothetical protein